MKDLFLIEFVFENLDYVVIPAACFIKFDSNYSSIKFELSHRSNLDLIYFQRDICTESLQTESALFDRLLFNDITSIRLLFCDGTSEHINVSWDADSRNNAFQNSSIIPNGNICVTIKRE